MTEMSEQIYRLLSSRSDWVRVKELAAMLGVPERSLRGRDSIFDCASRHIFQRYRQVVIRRTGSPAGVKLSDNPAEILASARQLEKHMWSESRTVEALKQFAGMLAKPAAAPQLTLWDTQSTTSRERFGTPQNQFSES